MRILLKLAVATAGAAFIAMGSAEIVQAVTLSADTTGSTNFQDPDFYGISFNAGSASATTFIQSVTYTLRTPGNDTDAFFDFSGPGASVGDARYGPIVQTSTLVGLSSSDITFAPNTGTPTILTINFATNSFGVGDSFRFGADTDNLSDNSGGAFGFRAVSFAATLQGGTSSSTRFLQNSPTQSTLTLAVPEPLTIFGSGMALFFGVLMERQYSKKRKQA